MTRAGIPDLAAELRKPIVGLKLECLPGGAVAAVTIWRPDGTRLNVSSGMHEIGLRAEMGSLVLTLFDYRARIEPDISLAWPQGCVGASVLVSRCDGWEAEAGLVLEGSGETRLTIAAAAGPHTLYVALPDGRRQGELEFGEHDYRRVSLGESMKSATSLGLA